MDGPTIPDYIPVAYDIETRQPGWVHHDGSFEAITWDMAMIGNRVTWTSLHKYKGTKEK